jgi:hypothetical protein
MKHWFLFICLSVACWGAQAQSPDCAQFKHGKYAHVKDGQILGSITRKGDVQIERYGDVKIVCQVRWLNACEYELYAPKGNKAWESSLSPGEREKVVCVKITRTEADGYWLQATFAGKKDDKPHEMHVVRAQ